ncbi:MAG TPA: hypothetical protein PLX06_06025, partial [Fimbriimonadaceae bacterium]|nr:hypothetical protein [Fimbriimonadaceae bacterium]
NVEGVDLHLPVDGLLDPVAEVAKIDRECEKLQGQLKPLEARLSNPQFIEKAKSEIVEREKAAVEELRLKLDRLQERRHLFG